MSPTKTKHNKTFSSTLILLVFVGVMMVINQMIIHQVQDATASFEQSATKPAKLSMTASRTKKVFPLETMVSPENNLINAENQQPVIEKAKKNKKIVYEMPINDEILPQ